MDLATAQAATVARLLQYDGEPATYDDGTPVAVTALFDTADNRATYTEQGSIGNLSVAWVAQSDLAEPKSGATLTRDPSGTPVAWTVQRFDLVGGLWGLQLVRAVR